MAKSPVYGIEDFQSHDEGTSFYANHLNKHVKEHVFTRLPHKHDFYLVMLVTRGSGWHEIDFRKYPVRPGRIFFMQPGQMHYWNLSKDINGYVFFHSKSFFDEGYTLAGLHDFPFFRSTRSVPSIQLDKNTFTMIRQFMSTITQERASHLPYRHQRLHAWISLVYTGLARVYHEGEEVKNRNYLEKLHRFEQLIEKHYKDHKLPSFYADKLNITEKHLNRIGRECVNKTSTQLIAERVVLEAKRLLMRSGMNVTETGYELGFDDKSYFVRFFRKQVGFTPLAFLKNTEKKID
jgi:AraC-like DNA-binding protein